MRFAEIVDGTVVNVIEAESAAWVASALPGVWVECGSEVGIAWRYDETGFVEPVVINPANRLKITTAEFVEMFTPPEYIKIDALLGTHPVITQLYKVAEVQGTVDLSSPKLAIALNIFKGENILTEARAEEILAGLPE